MHIYARLLVALLALLGASTTGAAGETDQDALPRNLTQGYLLDRYASPASTFAYLNRTLVHYQDQGEGPPVLLIHGSLQDLYDWDRWAEVLSRSYRVIRFDMPAAGLTGPVQSGDYSIANTMRTVDALMERLGEQRFAVVGTSLGGVVAFRYAATRPDRVGALVLMNSAGVEWGNEKIIPPQPQRYNESLSEDISKSNFETIIAAVLPATATAEQKRVTQRLDYQRREGKNLESAAIVEAYERGNPGEMLARITAPTLVLWGANNRALDPGVADEFVRLLTCAETVEKALVPDAGHWPHVEAPMRSVSIVEEFFSENYRSQAAANRGTCD